jgi:hypothetical protein
MAGADRSPYWGKRGITPSHQRSATVPRHEPYINFACRQVADILQHESGWQPCPGEPCKLLVTNESGTVVSLDLTPAQATPQGVTAYAHFDMVRSATQLLDAYQQIRSTCRFEDDLAALVPVHPFARDFVVAILSRARASLSDEDAIRIAQWAKHLDAYTAVKAVEALLNSNADLALLKVAAAYGWTVHFDHVAIRCGSSRERAAERVVELLVTEHGYLPSQVSGEEFYAFPDGWNAYPLYKMLDNGQMLRLFIDQSDATHPAQIIQHWHHVYGYTAHHMALRATREINGARLAVPLADVMAALATHGVESMTPTGEYTQGLLLQVFTRPERNPQVPDDIKAALASVDAKLPRAIENGKLLEIVSRREMSATHARSWFALYGIEYQPHNPLHSAPVYGYFLPAQAAHVIKTSI